jgi:hypothetical protein
VSSQESEERSEKRHPIATPLILPDAAEFTRREEAEEKRLRQNQETILLNLQGSQAKSQAIQAILTAALFCASIISGVISYWQFKAAKDNANAALTASIAAFQQMRAAQDANRLAALNSAASDVQNRKVLHQTIESNSVNREALVSVQRAFVLFDFRLLFNILPDPGKPDNTGWYEFSARIENTGATPTRDFISHINWAVRGAILDMNSFDFKDSAGSESPSTFVLGPHQSAPVGGIKVDRSIVAGLQGNPRIYLYFYGWATYRDVFNNTPRHVTMFCSEAGEFRGNPNLMSGSPQIVWKACPKHNCADGECDGEKGNPLKETN